MTTSCVLSLFFFFLLEETKLRSNRTPHPPALAVVFLVFPRRFVLFRLFWPCVLFVLVFLRGAILGPVRFLDSLGTALMPFWTRGGRGVCSLFLVCCFSRFAAHTFLGGRAPARRKAGPWVLALTPHPSEGGRPCPSRAEGLRPPPVWFFFVASICLGHRGPGAFSFLLGRRLRRP